MPREPACCTIVGRQDGGHGSDGKAHRENGIVGVVVVPHAGYPYSGQVAAYSFKLLEGLQFDTVVVIGPNHTVMGFNDVSVWSEGVFKTPLGLVPVDTELAKAIIASNHEKFVSYPRAHYREHSIEVELPFLQVVLSDFKIVPIVIGDCSLETCKSLARVINDNKGNKRILVVSSNDLSHDKSYEQAIDMDKLGLGYIADLNIDKLVQAEKTKKTEMCGYGPVLTLMSYVLDVGNGKGIVLQYKNSGDVVGNRKSRIVGYGAVAFYKEGNHMNAEYTNAERKELLKLARDTIKNNLTNESSGSDTSQNPKFKENRGVFVTLHKQGQLRGCIGYIESIKPLYQAVIDNAVSSAIKDFRFSPVKLNELAELDIEISVLTPPEEVGGADDFIPGEHGIIIRKGFRSAVFLPQVAPEQGWDRATTLSHLCLKAGLAPDDWQKPGMKFYVFRAEVFGEKEPH